MRDSVGVVVIAVVGLAAVLGPLFLALGLLPSVLALVSTGAGLVAAASVKAGIGFIAFSTAAKSAIVAAGGLQLAMIKLTAVATAAVAIVKTVQALKGWSDANRDLTESTNLLQQKNTELRKSLAEKGIKAFREIGESVEQYNTRLVNLFRSTLPKFVKGTDRVADSIEEAGGEVDNFTDAIEDAKRQLDRFDLKTAISQANTYDQTLKDLAQDAVDDLAKIAVPDLTESMRLATSQTEFLNTAAVNLATDFGQEYIPKIDAATLANVNLENALGTLGIKSQAMKDGELKTLREAVDEVKRAMDRGDASTTDFKNAQDALQKAIDGPQGSSTALVNLTVNIGKLGGKITDDLMGLLKGQGSIGDVGKAAFDLLSTAVLDFAGEAVLGLLKGELTKTLDLFKSVGDAASKLFGAGAAAGNIAISQAPGATTGAGVPTGGGGGIPSVGGALPVIDTIAGVVTAVSSVIANFQFRRMNKLLDLIEKSTRFSWITLGGRADQGILGVLFGIKESIDFGTATKAVEAIAGDVAGLGGQHFNASFDTMKTRLLTIGDNTSNSGAIVAAIGDNTRAIGRLETAIKGARAVTVEMEVQDSSNNVVRQITKAIKLNTGGLRTTLQAI